MLRLGKIILNVPFFQSPLSGYSDYAMRTISRRLGCPLTFAGVMLAKSAANPKVLKKKLFLPGEDEHPVGAQILGSEPAEMVKAAVALEAIGYDIIDLNFACPAPKVLRRGRGGALLAKPDTAIEMMKAVRGAVKCPVMVKLRIGRDESDESKEDFWTILQAADDEGIDAVTVHGRVVINSYRGKADWNIVSQVKQKFSSLTVIGSGDLLSAQSALDALRDSKIDGITIARGAIGNPWIFSELKAHFDGCGYEPPTIKEQKELILHHFELVCRLYPDKKAVRYFRKFLPGYCKYHSKRKEALLFLMEARTSEQFISKIEQLYN
ncbi:MAG: tRNA-dihydrouridine synthase family protein [Phycisphaerae bacterium]|jgi:nifR3 family TIM-barrel protein